MVTWPCGVNVPPMRAHWCHLANALESVLPSAHPSPHPKWQMNRFSHFCTAHGSVSSGMPRHVLSPNNCPFASAIWLHLMHASLGPLEPKQHHDRFGRFCTVQIRVSSGMSRHVLPKTPKCPKTPKNTSFLGVTQPPGVAQPLYSRGHN